MDLKRKTKLDSPVDLKASFLSNLFWNRILEAMRKAKDPELRRYWQTGLYFYQQGESTFHAGLSAVAASSEWISDRLEAVFKALRLPKDRMLQEMPASIISHYRKYTNEQLPDDFTPKTPDPRSFASSFISRIKDLTVKWWGDIYTSINEVIPLPTEELKARQEFFNNLDELGRAYHDTFMSWYRGLKEEDRHFVDEAIARRYVNTPTKIKHLLRIEHIDSNTGQDNRLADVKAMIRGGAVERAAGSLYKLARPAFRQLSAQARQHRARSTIERMSIELELNREREARRRR